MAIKPNKHSSVLALQRVGLFLQSVVQLFLSIGWAYWIPILISFCSYNKKRPTFPLRRVESRSIFQLPFGFVNYRGSQKKAELPHTRVIPTLCIKPCPGFRGAFKPSSTYSISYAKPVVNTKIENRGILMCAIPKKDSCSFPYKNKFPKTASKI